MKKQKVCIIGGGVGGLACAHELSKSDKYDIYVIERNQELGGQARSISYIDCNTDCDTAGSDMKETYNHSEYCWHAIHQSYLHFLTIMSEIPAQDGFFLIEHLKPVNRIFYRGNQSYAEINENAFVTDYSRFIKGYEELYKKKLPLWQKMKLISIITRCICACDERLEDWDNYTWKSFLERYDLEPELMRWLLDSTSIFLGMDYNSLSLHTMAMLFRNKGPVVLNPKYVFYSFDAPMSYILFDNWEKHLKKNNVQIYKNISATSIHMQNNKIHKICGNHSIFEQFDENTIYINAMDAESLSKLINLDSNKRLASLGHQIQTQVLFKFKKPCIDADYGTVVIHHDSPWFLMTRIESTFWKLKGQPIENDYWSVGIGMWDVPGLNGKTANKCSREEIARECWEQIRQHMTLPEWNDQIEWDIWNSFVYKNGELTTYEPKWTNTAGTLKARPLLKDSIENLYNATAYAKNQTVIFNMEGAAESGRHVAHLIMNKSFGSYTFEMPLVLKLCKWCDKIIFKTARLIKFLKNKLLYI